jgi:hypothetical protein
VILVALIGAKGLYLLFAWLLSAAIAAWLTERKGYGERVGLTFGLLLSVIGLIICVLLPGRPGSRWKVEGPIPKRRRGAARARAGGGKAGGGGAGGEPAGPS